MTQKYRSLLPKNDMKLDNYLDALNYAMDTDEIRNIALSGSYGSGKSSVINSYENVYSGKRFLHVTLADFEEQHRPKPNAGDTAQNSLKNTVDLLEGKILNQLLHQIDVTNIPQSRFRSKTADSSRLKIRSVVFAVLFAAVLLYSIRFEAWQALVNTLPSGPFFLNIAWTAHPSLRVAGILLSFAMGGWGLFHLLHLPNLRRLFKKIDVKGISIEVFETEADSLFDRYLDEVLYLFEHSGADAIVFEDLDRYDVTRIFEKLKEISDLLYLRKRARGGSTAKMRQEQAEPCEAHKQQEQPNQDMSCLKKALRSIERFTQRLKKAPEIEEIRSVPKFFYLIRDNVFSSSDRTKFFDFIIPVVPVIATGNAYDLMFNRFKQQELENTFDQHFLRDVSLYLSDLRLVHNIVNEYILYQDVLNDSELTRDPNRQLAMIIYKNLFPQDFEQLQHGQGYVFELFQKRDSLLAVKQARVDQETEQLRLQIEQAESDHLQNIDELNALFFPFDEKINEIDGKPLDSLLSRTELVKRLMEADTAFFTNSYSRNNKVSLNKLRKKMEQDPTYQARKTTLEKKAVLHAAALNDRLPTLLDERHRLDTLTLRELIPETDSDFWASNDSSYALTSSREFPLLKYLILQGYIDEQYSIYISYFHPNSLTARDKNFCMSLYERRQLDYAYPLDNPQAVLEQIGEAYFSRDEVSNFALFDHLLAQGRSRELDLWLDSIDNRSEAGTPVFDFPSALWRHSPHHTLLTQVINERMPHWFQLWTRLGVLSEDDWHQYALDTLLHSGSETLARMNDEKWLATAISIRKNFLHIEDPETEALIEKFKLLGVRFCSIEYREQDAALVRRVYEEHLYDLNQRTLTLWLNLFYGTSDNTALGKSYTYFLRKPDELLSRWAEEHADAYMYDLLHIGNLRFSDEPDAVAALLRHPDIQIMHKKGYIGRLDTQLDKLTDIEPRELWPDLLEAGLVSFIWENIADYYNAFCVEDNSLDEALCGFIEAGAADLTWTNDKLAERIGAEAADSLLLALLDCPKLSPERYRAVWASLNIMYSNLALTELPDSHILGLIELGVVEVTAENAKLVRASYPAHMANFALNDGGYRFTKLAAEGSFLPNEAEMKLLLEDCRMTTQAATRLLSVYSGTLSVSDMPYPAPIKAAIINAHFDISDIEWLLRNYDAQEKTVRNAFLHWAKNNFQEFFTAAIAAELIPVPVYAACLECMTPVQAEELRRYLADPNFEAVCSSNEALQFPYSEDAHMILQYFLEHDWISAYRKRHGMYRAVPKQRKAVEV